MVNGPANRGSLFNVCRAVRHSPRHSPRRSPFASSFAAPFAIRLVIRCAVRHSSRRFLLIVHNFRYSNFAIQCSPRRYQFAVRHSPIDEVFAIRHVIRSRFSMSPDAFHRSEPKKSQKVQSVVTVAPSERWYMYSCHVLVRLPGRSANGKRRQPKGMWTQR